VRNRDDCVIPNTPFSADDLRVTPITIVYDVICTLLEYRYFLVERKVTLNFMAERVCIVNFLYFVAARYSGGW
jgi:hypothetical protein